MDAWTITGTLASFAGVGVGIWTLKTAQGAKQAAKQAATRAKERDLVEELESAHEKSEQVGIVLLSRDWSVAHLRAMEIQHLCNGAAVRWDQTLSEQARNDLVLAGGLAQSVANEVQQLQIGPEQPKKRKQVGETQLKVSQLVSGVLAEARRRIEEVEE